MRHILATLLILTACARKEETKPSLDCHTFHDLTERIVNAALSDANGQTQDLVEDVQRLRYIAADESASPAERKRARELLALEPRAAAEVAKSQELYGQWQAAMQGLKRRPTIPREMGRKALYQAAHATFEAYATTCSDFQDASGKPLVTQR